MIWDCDLFSKLYISCQTQDGNLDQFFSNENQATPLVLSTEGKLRFGIKANLLRCLKKDLPGETGVAVVDAAILDGTAVVQMLNPGISKTFQEYADAVFVPYISAQLEKTDRVNIVLDIYLPDNSKRGKGIRKRVASSTLLPKNWRT